VSAARIHRARAFRCPPGRRPPLNVNGSGISLAHPIGATGVRIGTTLVHELRRRGGRLALETMCVGGGQGMAVLIEAP
jgi:acetyl-CoA C-acetyltransferase